MNTPLLRLPIDAHLWLLRGDHLARNSSKCHLNNSEPYPKIVTMQSHKRITIVVTQIVIRRFLYLQNFAQFAENHQLANTPNYNDFYLLLSFVYYSDN